MQVDFYRSNEQNAPTVEHYLFTKELSQIMNGEYIEEAGQHYQVISQPIPDQPAFPERVGLSAKQSKAEAVEGQPALMVFVYPVQRKPVEINI